jgi:hypothetical protein
MGFTNQSEPDQSLVDFSAGLCRKLRMMRLYSLGFSI